MSFSYGGGSLTSEPAGRSGNQAEKPTCGWRPTMATVTAVVAAADHLTDKAAKVDVAPSRRARR
ncbi:hypothetical protein [Mycobacterium bourgelatii]|uniref:hypothetical protein n=1 Tax=Mycobacterium bourgelatii TaxID=1273442 RepID=UPI001F07FE0E|nr:hypothetical protein [Mycobacterium bourgelatii]